MQCVEVSEAKLCATGCCTKPHIKYRGSDGVTRQAHSVQDESDNHLIDRVVELPEYEFFCHAQIVTELNWYNADAPIWLSEKIGAQKIKSYTDQEILESLSLVRGPLACATYTQMLKLACDAFSKDYFWEHYQALEEADYATISREDYLK